MKLSAPEQERVSGMLEWASGQALARFNAMGAGEWTLEPLDWDTAPENFLKGWPLGDETPQKFYGMCFPMPGAAVLALFPPSTASALILARERASGSASPLIVESEALAEIALSAAKAFAAVLAEAGHLDFTPHPPEVLLAPRASLLEKMHCGSVLLQGPGQEPPLRARILFRSGRLECMLAVSLSAAWRNCLDKPA